MAILKAEMKFRGIVDTLSLSTEPEALQEYLEGLSRGWKNFSPAELVSATSDERRDICLNNHLLNAAPQPRL